MFLPLVLLLYYATPKRFRNVTLFIVDLVFYSWGEPMLVLLMLVSILINYIAGILIGINRRKKGVSKFIFITAIVLNLGLLGFFKYVGFYRNVNIRKKDSARYVADYGRRMYKAGHYIQIGDSVDYQLVCYDESTLLKRLSQYPYWQLGIVMIFVVVAIFALLSSKRAEQNKVWVGLSKETAHQLGTPISSLMAWVEILKENYPDDELIPEMNKDVKRLELIAERFSKIGSLPEPVEASMNEVLAHVIDYMDRRTSKKVEIVSELPAENVVVKMNASLFEWVIENLCKNAVDAMEGQGRIVLSLHEEGSKVAIEVTDNGKGIRKKDLKNVFTPGFTTKKRGWGLGLSLAKRIVEEYHKGRIYVKSSEVGVGTTFRIEMPK